MQMLTVDPGDLLPNPWNSNVLTPDAMSKLVNSISRLSMFKPVVARRLDDGNLQILGGQHRAEAASVLGIAVPVVDLGVIDDVRAREIGLVDNGRYGHDDSDRLAEILAELGDPAELAAFLPFDLAELDAMTKIAAIDLDQLEHLDDEDAAPVEKREAATKTHCLMRFRVPIENQGMIEEVIKRIIDLNDFDDSDAMVNAGDALTILAGYFEKTVS